MAESAGAPPGKTVRDPERYREALDGWLRRQLPDADGLRVHDVDLPRATGFSNETVFFSASPRDGPVRRYVARIEPEDGGLFPVQAAGAEVSVALQHRVMSDVTRASSTPLPPLLPLEADRGVLGRPFFVMEFVPGEVPADVPRYSQAGFVAERATPQERECMVRDGLERMAALHRLEWRSSGLMWLDASGSGEPALCHQLDLYRRYVARELAGREHPVLERAFDWLEARDPELPVGLSWGDARLGNMIWQDYRCAAVLDWEAAALAPPQADVGWWLMFDRMSFDDLGAPRLAGFPTRDAMVAIWEAASGLAAGDVEYWEVFALMRFCAVMIKLGDRMARAGMLVDGRSLAIGNGVTEALERRLRVQGF